MQGLPPRSLPPGPSWGRSVPGPCWPLGTAASSLRGWAAPWRDGARRWYGHVAMSRWLPPPRRRP
eukprot:5520365-Pyramimonas_sp.AAC.1